MAHAKQIDETKRMSFLSQILWPRVCGLWMPVVWTLCLSVLAGVLTGCVHPPNPSSVQEAASSGSPQLGTGAVRLQCEAACLVRWNANSRHIKALHDNRLWADLAQQVMAIDYPSDLTYYYLGRAAEGMGYPEAATTYYRLAISHLHRCESWVSDCAGFDFPRDIRVRLAALTPSKAPSQTVAVTQKTVPSTPPVAALGQPASAPRARSGTGFFINAEGLMVTNWHVVERATQISVSTPGYSKRAAQVLGKDAACDLAVLKVSSGATHWLSIQRSVKKVRRGSEVLTVGFPRVDLQGLESKVTNGLVSSLSGVSNDPRFFQISVPIQPGNSGGPLVSRDGLVVGVVSAKLSTQTAWNEANVAPENVNYAVKSNCLVDLMRTLPGKHRYDMKRIKFAKANKKTKQRGQSRELSLVDLTERVEKAVGLVTVTVDPLTPQNEGR